MGGQWRSEMSISQLEDMARHDHERALGHLSELSAYLPSDSIQERRRAIRVCTTLSARAPFEMQSLVSSLLPRLDDVDSEVRTNTIIAVANLAQWYPHHFGTATPLLVDALESNNDYERASALHALVTIGKQRPDIVSPRDEALSHLISCYEDREYQQFPEDAPSVSKDDLQSAISALEGGDLASRDVEEDLVPVGRATDLSSPARVGIAALCWGPLAVVTAVMGVVFIIQFIFDDRPPKQQTAQLGVLGFFKNRKRARLYLRQSVLPTPSTLLPVLPGSAPLPKDEGRTQPEPADWDVIINAVWNRDKQQCRNCLVETEPGGDYEPYVDAKVPFTNGGSRHPTNLRTLCFGCLQARYGDVITEEE
jgi:hypothetical protein